MVIVGEKNGFSLEGLTPREIGQQLFELFVAREPNCNELALSVAEIEQEGISMAGGINVARTIGEQVREAAKLVGSDPLKIGCRYSGYVFTIYTT